MIQDTFAIFALYPDFRAQEFFLGFIESYGYGWYLALVWVSVYNVFAVRRTAGKHRHQER